MELTDIRELYACPDKYIGQEVTVGGWVRSLRDSKAFGFIVLNSVICTTKTSLTERCSIIHCI